MNHELLGQTLGGRYHFEALLGEGSFARVYRVTDLHRRATLAAKVLRHDIAQDPAFLERFRREAAVLARLQHPNIVRYYDTVELNDTLFILMDYVPGQTLEKILVDAAGPLKPYGSLTYLTPLASALHFAHHEGVIHRDLKPANILLHENGTLYVTDFGIARMLNVTSELTMGISIGTPFYMAPEQITGEPVTVATDIYALGIVLYRMYTGYLPFRGVHPGTSGTSTASRITYEHVHIEPERPTKLNPNLDLAVQEIVLRCLQKNPARRFRSVSELYDALTEAVGAPPIALETADTSAKPPDLKLPEWSQFMAQVEQVEEEEEYLPPPPMNKIEHPVPLPPTEPHLEKALRDASRARTVPALGHMLAPQPRPVIAPPPPAYIPAPPAPARRRTNWAMIAAISGIALVVIVLCLATIYLLTYADQDKTPPATETPAAATEPLPPAPTAEQRINRIVFDSERSGNPDIYIMNIDGSDLRQLTGTSGAENGPAWSPDGSQIAFYGSASTTGNDDIFITNSDGTGLRNLTNSPDTDDKYPSWSPDGTQLVFHSDADGDYDLYLVNIDGTGLRAITNNDADDLGPDWSPEGSQIAFHTDAWGEPYEIAILNLATFQVRRLTNNDDTNAFPTWSPDGVRIAFHAISALDGTLNIYIMDMQTNNVQQLTTGQHNAFPDWSPDGVTIIYQSGRPEVSAIYMIPVSGGTPLALTGTQSNFLPEWEPQH